MRLLSRIEGVNQFKISTNNEELCPSKGIGRMGKLHSMKSYYAASENKTPNRLHCGWQVPAKPDGRRMTAYFGLTIYNKFHVDSS